MRMRTRKSGEWKKVCNKNFNFTKNQHQLHGAEAASITFAYRSDAFPKGQKKNNTSSCILVVSVCLSLFLSLSLSVWAFGLWIISMEMIFARPNQFQNAKGAKAMSLNAFAMANRKPLIWSAFHRRRRILKLCMKSCRQHGHIITLRMIIGWKMGFSWHMHTSARNGLIHLYDVCLSSTYIHTLTHLSRLWHGSHCKYRVEREREEKIQINEIVFIIEDYAPLLSEPSASHSPPILLDPNKWAIYLCLLVFAFREQNKSPYLI